MSSASKALPASDAGFGMLELLLALAIAGAVALGIGGLVGFGVELRDRTSRGAAIESGLTDIGSLSATLERLRASRLESMGPGAMSLRGDAEAEAPQLVIGLEENVLIARVLSRNEIIGETTRIDLAAFDSARFEYLVTSSAEWVSDPRGRAPRAARLAVTAGHRMWPVVLWVSANRGGLQ